MASLHYIDPNPHGGPAVFLLHGLGADCSTWALQMNPLMAAGFRPIAPDMMGFGRSVYDGRGWRIARAAQQVAGLLEELEITSAHVVGISMGGVIAQQFALDYPRLTRSLVLCNTFAVLRPKSLRDGLYFSVRFVLVHLFGLKRQAQFVASAMLPQPDQELLRKELIRIIAQSDPRAYRAAMRALALFNSTAWLPRIQAPTLVITAERDTTVPLSRQRMLAESIPHARQVIIPGAGHAVSVESFEIFNQELLSFLQAAP